MLGLVGAGNMARALARGWGEPVLVHDPDRSRAEALVAELGGEVVDGNGTLAEQADLVVLAHKPAQLADVAREIGGRARAVVSILGGVSLAALHAAYGDTPVFRVLPSLPAEIGRGVTTYAPEPDADPALEAEVVALFERVGSLVRLPEAQFGVAVGLMSCAPAYVALLVEAQVDAAVRAGMPAHVAAPLVTDALAGTAALVAARGHDTLAIRREVTSPGGITARGLDALERGGLRTAFADAMDATTGAA